MPAIVELLVKAVQPQQEFKKLDQAAQRLRATLESVNQSIDRQRQLAAQAGSQLGNLAAGVGKLAVAYVGLRTAQQAVQAGIQRDESARRLKFLAQGFNEVGAAQQAATRSGQTFGLSITEANQQFAQLYGRLRPLNVSLADIEAAFIGFNTAAKVSGATTAESAGALLQLTQALGSGVLRGQELNSVLEQAPGLVVALTKELGRPVSEIRKLAEEGEITSEIVIRALKRAGTEGADELTEALNGPAQAIKMLQNEFENLQVTATNELLPQIIDSVRILTNTLKAIAPIIRGIGAVAGPVLNYINSLIEKATGVERERFKAARMPSSSGMFGRYGAPSTQVRSETEANTMTQRLLGKQVGGRSTAQRAAEKAETLAKRNAQQISDAQSLLNLAKAQYSIEGQILIARSQNNEALVTTRTTQKELANIANEIAEIRANKELPDAAKLAKIAELEIKAKGASRQLAFDLATAEKEKAKNAADAMQKLLDEQALMQARLNGNEAEVLLNQQIRDLKAQYPALNEADVRTTLEKTNALKQQVDAANELKQLYTDIGTSIKSGVVDAIQGAINGTKSLQEVANNLLGSIANKLLDVAVNFALFGAMSGTGTGGGLLGGLFKKRAMGGSVTAGQPYLVGERGPELFMPGRSGGIAPAGGFGGANVVVNVDASGSNVQGNQPDAAALGRVVGAAVQAELIKQKRPGGLLA